MNNRISKNIKFNKMRNNNIYSGCIHKNEFCDKEISRAHSIQNNGILSKISRHGKVMALDFSKIYLNNGEFTLNEVGRNKASTFTGFCNKHDSEIFRPIDSNKYEEGNFEHNFLFAYRAFALSYYERYSSYQLMGAKLEENSNLYQSELGERYTLYGSHLDDIEKIRLVMNNNLDNKRFDRITTNVLVWPDEYGIASTSMFFIVKDNLGRTINKMSTHYSPFFFTLFPQSGKTYVLLSYYTKSKFKYHFVKEEIMNMPIEEQKVAISNLIAIYIENIFISPEYWDNIPEDIKMKYYDIFNKTMGGNKPAKLIAFKDFNLFV
ncbi:hypothetical protein [Paenibacillus sp. FSL M7-0896]|uniref:hypothetical protein n=1 Tax=Paenibacillus sp. FSL M7-0896 TaxID=2921610 RepID=UPI0030DDA2E8